LRPNGYVHNPITWTDPLGLKFKECCFSFSSYEQARNAALRKIDEHGGIDPSSRVAHTNKGLGGSSSKGKVDGFTGRTKDGKPVTFRLDYDPGKETHINLNIGKGDTMINHAYQFPGTEKDFLKLLEQFN